MSWFTDARVRRLTRKLKERNGALIIIERMRAAQEDRANRLAGELTAKRTELIEALLARESAENERDDYKVRCEALTNRLRHASAGLSALTGEIEESRKAGAR